MSADSFTSSVGWIGAGRMGTEMARRLLASAISVVAWNRTPERLEPLIEEGARQASLVSELRECEVVFAIVSDATALESVLFGDDGLLDGSHRPRVVVDCSTIGVEAAAELRARAAELGSALLAAPVSGNPSVVAAGELSFACSGERSAFERVEPLLGVIGASATYIGEGDLARIAKICHNLVLGIAAEALAEVLVLGESAGIRRAELMAFLNSSVVGSRFSEYKTPAYVGLDFSPTFTPRLLRKDFDLGFALADEHAVAMPVAAATREAIQATIGPSTEASDFAVLLSRAAEAAGLDLEPQALDAAGS